MKDTVKALNMIVRMDGWLEDSGENTQLWCHAMIGR